MARQRPTRLVMGPCIIEIDRIVIREVQYQLEVNRCRNEEIIVKGNFGWAWPMWAGRPRIDRIVIREVQYQFEAILCGSGLCERGALGLVMGPCIVEINRIVIREVQYQFEVNQCKNEEIIVKGNFVWAWRLVMGPCIVEIDRIVIREVQYQFEDNRCRNEEIIFQGSSANSAGDNSAQDGQTDRQTAEITTISLRFSKTVGKITSRAEVREGRAGALQFRP
ncbi:hypothetical protein DPMN_170399 [Dreissena polymorpha]|uniref:Uncharacterized protein n=1 Tax=Dreissena polymorpha TaxID=45954 RepID=A0A9D4DYB2_DREPO|nr:hypothetical protein DPMN_170399 [Dreissena polymorpha]